MASIAVTTAGYLSVVESREQIEDMLKDTDATLVFVEHDRHFVEKIATDIIDMS